MTRSAMSSTRSSRCSPASSPTSTPTPGARRSGLRGCCVTSSFPKHSYRSSPSGSAALPPLRRANSPGHSDGSHVPGASAWSRRSARNSPKGDALPPPPLHNDAGPPGWGSARATTAPPVRPARGGCGPGGISPRAKRMLHHGPAARHLRGSVAMTGTASTAPPRLLGLIADDLTGAADSAVGFAEHGWRVEVALRSAALRMLKPSIATVLALTTESRALPDPDAAQQTFTAANELITAGAERLY